MNILKIGAAVVAAASFAVPNLAEAAPSKGKVLVVITAELRDVDGPRFARCD